MKAEDNADLIPLRRESPVTVTAEITDKLYSKRSNRGSLPAVQHVGTNRRPVVVQYMRLAFSFVLNVHRTLTQSQI